MGRCGKHARSGARRLRFLHEHARVDNESTLHTVSKNRKAISQNEKWQCRGKERN